MAEAILLDSKLIVPCSTYLQGEYGLSDICFGVPCKLGANGVEQIIELELTADEKQMAEKSVKIIRETMGALKL
jgi:malate dehydrogenase